MRPADPVLVTGATGFIGSHLVRRLLALGTDVHVMVRRSSDLSRIREEIGRVTCHHGELEEEGSVRAAVEEARPRTIFHFASHGGHPGQEDPDRVFRTNLSGTAHLLSSCGEFGFSRFVHAGSSTEYGKKDGPMTETDVPVPYDAYGASKAGATLWLAAAASSRGLPTVTLRLFSPYGPMDDPARLIPAAARAFLRGESPRLASPEAVRDFIYIEDVVDACLRAAVLPEAVGEILNVGSGRETSAGEVVGLLARLVPGAPAPEWGAVPPRPGSSCWVAEIGRAKRLLRWQPRVGLEEGLRRTVEWMRNETV